MGQSLLAQVLRRIPQTNDPNLLVDAATCDDIYAEIGTYDWLVFSSANGVRHFFQEFFTRFKDLRSLGVMRIACVGRTTAAAIRELHLEVEVCPEEGTAENLAQALADTGSLDSAKVLVVTGNLNRDVLVTKLEEARAIVDRFQVYENTKTDLTADPAADDFRQKGADAILFASSSAVESFVAQAGALRLAAGAKRPLAGSIGPQTSEAMKKVGMPIDFTAKTPGIEALVDALVKKLAAG